MDKQMDEVLGLMPLRHTEIAVGQTINWTIYNQDGQVLFEPGLRIEDQQQLNHLMDVGFCEADMLWDSIPSKIEITEKPASETITNTTTTPSPKSADELHKETIIELDSVRWTVGETFTFKPMTKLQHVTQLSSLALSKINHYCLRPPLRMANQSCCVKDRLLLSVHFREKKPMRSQHP